MRNDRTRFYVLIDNMDDWDESGSDTYFKEKVVSYCFRAKDPAKVTPGVGGQTEREKPQPGSPSSRIGDPVSGDYLPDFLNA